MVFQSCPTKLRSQHYRIHPNSLDRFSFENGNGDGSGGGVARGSFGNMSYLIRPRLPQPFHRAVIDTETSLNDPKLTPPSSVGQPAAARSLYLRRCH